jgi:Ca-activated chloride channel homolog
MGYIVVPLKAKILIRIFKYLVLFSFPIGATAQRAGGVPNAGSQAEMGATHLQFSIMDLQVSQARHQGEGQESRSDAVSKLDLKAPGKAKKEYVKGVRSLSKRDFNKAVQHLSNATILYPLYVAAHDALGIAYMDLGQHQQARDEFQAAASLDNHLPDSFANLCSAEIAIGDYSSAQRAIERASSLAPLNLEFLTTLTFAELLNRQYSQVVSTAHQLHERKHEGAAIVHYLAALAWQKQGDSNEMRSELNIFLTEDAKNPLAEQARQLLANIDAAKSRPSIIATIQMHEPTAAEVAEQKQIVEAEATYDGFSNPSVLATLDTSKISEAVGDLHGPSVSTPWIIRKTVDEVALLFAVTDHGKSVSNLTSQDVRIRDNDEPPAAVVDFRSEAELPLRLGLVIDTSGSIGSRFAFEQEAASRFVQNVLTNGSDLGFLVGFANSVLLVQDFSADQTQLSGGIKQLAPGGGTALWDAVAFASRKLGSRVERGVVARALVVISDGDDNSSTETLKQAIQAAQSEQVSVYTISTYEPTVRQIGSPPMGERALKLLAEQTGGASFAPGSIRGLDQSLVVLQEVLRSRYFISYKPAHLRLNGSFRSIIVNAEKSGHRLRVYSRKGYYAKLDSAGEKSF